MGKTFSTGLLTNGIWQDSSNNVGIGGAANASYKLAVTGTTLTTGAATFSSSVTSADLIVTDTYANDPLIKLATTTSGNVEVQMRTASTTYNAGIGVVTSGYDFGLFTNNTTRMTITSSGNVGIGSSNTDPLSLGRERNLAIVTTGTSAALTIVGGNNGRIDFGVGTTRTAGMYSDTTNFTEIFTSTALPLVFSTNNTERMRITSGGNVGIGTNSPTSIGTGYTTLGMNGTNGSGISLNVNGSTTGYLYVESGALVLNNTSGVMQFYNNGTERMRITSDGAVLVGVSSTPSSSVSGVALQNPRLLGPTLFSSGNVSDSRSFVQFINANGVVGQITTSGTSTSYVTSSDYRLKQDLKDYNGLHLVSAIKTYDYEWKSDQTRSYGVLAHELEEVIPQAVYGEKDGEEMQGVDYSKIVPILVKAIQELTAKVTALENK